MLSGEKEKMAKNKLQVVLCRTCLRDNPQEGDWKSFEANAKVYQQKLKDGFLRKHAELRFQNCFSYCEKFHCVQVTKNGEGFLLQKISTPQKVNDLVDWVKESKKSPYFELPHSLHDNLIAPVKPQEKYKKI